MSITYTPEVIHVQTSIGDDARVWIELPRTEDESTTIARINILARGVHLEVPVTLEVKNFIVQTFSILESQA